METSSVTVAADLSAKIIILCSKYFVDIAHARADIERLKKQLKNLETTLRHAHHLLEQSNGQLLSASRELSDAIQRCQTELQRLLDKLEPNATQKAMRRFGLRAAKWPFNKGEIEVVTASLVDYREAITAILQIDQTKLLLNINERIENLSLQSAENGSMDRKPHFMIPFPRDPDFVDRPVLREWLEEQYNANPTRRIALIGMGGFGKSQIVIEFAYRVHITSPETNIFWVHGGTEAKFEESYRSVANALTLPGRHEPNVNVLALVRDWLQKADAPPWLIILDNADEMETLFPKSQNKDNQQEPLASYLPKTGNGKVIITSRNRSVAEKLTGSHKAIQEVPTMDNVEALKILENKLSQDIDQDAAIDLARALDFIPLAVNQAAAYINRRAPRVSIRSYLDEFRQNEKQKKSLLNRDAGDLRRREDVSNSVVITWQVTFEQIRQERPTAANLLLLMSFFQPQNIPEFMLSSYNVVTSDCGDGNGDDDEHLEDDLDVLRGYSLIRLSTTSGLCDMHALVQFCTKIWLLESNESDFARLRFLFLSLSAKHFPIGDFETWARCQLLLPHMKPLLDEEPTDELGIVDWSELSANVSLYMLEIGDLFAGENIARTALKSTKRLLGGEDPKTIMLMLILSTIYYSRGRVDKSELLFVEMTETCQRTWGDEHLMTLSCMSNLLQVYQVQGKFKDAELLGLRVMKISKRIWGDEHPKTLSCMSSLAVLYRIHERFGDAELLEERVMKTSNRILGDAHPETLRSLFRLAQIYMGQERLAEAELLVMHGIEVGKGWLGGEHPNVHEAMNVLAHLFKKRGQLKEAESLLLQVLDSSERVLGDGHLNVLDTMFSLVVIFREQGRLDDALVMLRDTVSRMQRTLGPDAPFTLKSLKALRRLEQEQAQGTHTGEFEDVTV